MYYLHNFLNGSYGVIIVKKVGSEARFAYVELIILKVFFILVPLIERSTRLSRIFHLTVRAAKTLYSTFSELVLEVRVMWSMCQ
jgi:hypothetical protein